MDLTKDEQEVINLREEGLSQEEIFKKVKGKVTRDRVRELCPDETPKKTLKREVSYKEDGTRTYEGEIDCDMDDDNAVMKAFGVKQPERWQIKNRKLSDYEMQLKGGEVQTLHASKIHIEPRTTVNEEEVLKHFIEKAENYSPVTLRTIKQSGENILIVNICDVHIGQLSWGEKNGENYDYKIATKRCKEIVQDVITKSPFTHYNKIYIVLGNDFFNSDTPKGETTGGTQQVNDVRPEKMFNKGCDLLVWIVEALRTSFPDTAICTKHVPGNHDKITMYHASKYLYAWFRNDTTVEIDISPALRKGIAFGITALFFTHGQYDLKNMEWAYRGEFRKLIAQTEVTEIHGAHLHRIKVEEKNGVLIRTSSSVAPVDDWSDEHGYGSVARAITRIYSKQKGLGYELYSKV